MVEEKDNEKMAEENKPEVKEQITDDTKQESIDNFKLDRSSGSSSEDSRTSESSQVEQARDGLTSINVNNKKDKAEVKEKDSKVEKKAEKKDEVKAPKKTEVLVNGRDLRISTKQAVAICRFIRGKDVDKAIGELEEVSKIKRAVPMKGELPHRKGKGMMSGRFPVKTALEFIKLLKSLRANAINHEVELEKVRVSAMANVASRPYRRFGRERFKRSHVKIRLVGFERKNKSKNKQEVKK